MRKLVGLLGLVVLVACSDDRLTAPEHDAGLEPAFMAATAADQVVVMSRNMYVGAPVEPILAETDPNQIPIRVAQAWAILIATDFPARARAMAEEIVRARPHLIGLQEVTLLRSQFPSDIVVPPGQVPNLAPNASNVAFDFLATLKAELAARGLYYDDVAAVQNTDVEVPRFDGVQGGIPLFTDIRLTDFDVILARSDVGITNAAAANFIARIGPPFSSVTVLRGWTAVDATVGGTTYRFVNTHLEAEAEPIRFFQAQELMGRLALETKPVLLVGDLNSGPGRPASQGGQQTYDFILANGFFDTWTARPRPADPGFTCCHAGDLSNLLPNLEQRIDLILARNLGGLGPASGRPVANVWVVGDQAKDRRGYGVWPSDHAGVVARLTFPKPGVAD